MSLTLCPLCGAADTYQCASILLYHCRCCDLMFKDAALHLGPSDERKRYETHNNTLDNIGYVQMFESFLQVAVYPFVAPGAKVLDFGSGPEPVLQVLLTQQGYKADCYDPYFAPILPEGSLYDLITCTEALEHVYDPWKTWKSMLSLLKPAGMLSVMTHFHPGPQCIAKWWYIRDTTHVVFYSEKTFAWLAAEFGLVIEYSDGVKTIVLKARA